MKPLLFLACLLAIVSLQSCERTKKNKAADHVQSSAAKAQIPVPKANSNLIVNDKEDLIGYWVGMFETDTIYDGGYDNAIKINISIDTISGDEINGHSIIAGIVKSFSSTIKKDNSNFSFVVQQSNNGKHNGIFKFSIAVGDTLLSGKWNANNGARISSRKYELTKKTFQYNPAKTLAQGNFVGHPKEKKTAGDDDPDNEAFSATTEDLTKYNPSTELLTKEEVANLKKADLLVIRNSIFARHGYAFKKPELRAFFDQQDWYIPISNNVVDQLTAIEKKNIELINRYEKNAKEYYESFGR